MEFEGFRAGGKGGGGKGLSGKRGLEKGDDLLLTGQDFPPAIPYARAVSGGRDSGGGRGEGAFAVVPPPPHQLPLFAHTLPYPDNPRPASSPCITT
jgi:hypothetical protein